MRAGDLIVLPVAPRVDGDAGEDRGGHAGEVVLPPLDLPGDETGPETGEHLLTEGRERVGGPANALHHEHEMISELAGCYN